MNDDYIRRKTVKMPHMFQKTYFEPNSMIHDEEFFRNHEENLGKIAKSYRVIKDYELQSNTVVESFQKLLLLDSTEEFNTVYLYLDNLQKQFLKQQNNTNQPDVDDTPDEGAFENHEIDINQIIKSSEQEINNIKDQKTLLRSLIDDINLNSASNTRYDDEKFEQNMTEMINESLNDEEHAEILDNDEIIEKDNNVSLIKKKSKSLYILAFVIILLISAACYMYRDILFDIWKKIF